MSDEPFDRLLDSALSSYADPGPDSGLEQRVLVRIAEGSRTQTRSVRLWALALATAVPPSASGRPGNPHSKQSAHRTHRSGQPIPAACPSGDRPFDGSLARPAPFTPPSSPSRVASQTRRLSYPFPDHP